MKKYICAILSAGVLTSAVPFTATAAEKMDYEIIGLWCDSGINEYDEFTADGEHYCCLTDNIEEYYSFKYGEEDLENSSDQMSLYTYTAKDGILTNEGIDFSYTINGKIMTVTYMYDGELMDGGFTLEKVFDFGDVDDDGEINALDASAVLTEYAASATGGALELDFIQTKAADVNCDGAVDALDASEILGYYAYKATGGSGCFAEYYYG